jgi:phosphatidylinositol-3,4,5-trisphosphate 3-phosphatase and dual-specificity protein phosphatase PTEN
MESWLKVSPANVAVVHCKGGKGRTGVVIACYMVFQGLFDNPFQALDFFAAKRSSNKHGVSQPSQLR